MYNFGSTGLIVRVIEKTAKTLQFITFEGGKYYLSDIRKDTLVAIVDNNQDVSFHQPKEAYKTGKGMVDVSMHFLYGQEETPEEEIVNVDVEDTQVQSVPLKQITFTWSESNLIKKNTVVNTFADANHLIHSVAHDMLGRIEAGCTKTGFIIEWADGRKHEGRIDVIQSDIDKDNPIGEHVKYFYESLAGLKCPSGWSDEEYKNHLKAIYNIDEQGMQEVKDILNTYLLDDAAPEEPEKKPVPASQVVQIDEQEASSITVKLNEELNGIELYFSDIPSVEIRNQLKANGFRWSKRGFWYAKQSEKTLAIANSLNGSEATPNTTESIQEPITYPEIDINDLNQYTVSDELQNRLHSASMFQVDYKRDCRVTFEQIQSEALEVLSMTDNERIKYNVKKYLQSFKKRYYEMYLKMLNHRANNPGWMVTGRGGINIRRYNKKQEQYANMINRATEMMNDFKQRLSKFKDEIGREEQRAFEADLNSVTSYIEGTTEFTTETKQLDYMGLKQRVRTYNYNGFTIAKTWGCYRVFKNGKEIDTNLKTTSKLDDAKRFVLYLDHKEKLNK